MSSENDEAREVLAEGIGKILGFIFVLNIQAWLVSLCVSFVAPMAFLPFWQWLVIVFTFRFLLFIK